MRFPDSPSSGAARGRATGVLLALVVIAAALVFGRCVGFGFIVMDDGPHLVNNPLTEHPLASGWGALLRTSELGYPVPVTVLSYALERRLFGLSPGVFHASNVLVHLGNAVMLGLLARRLGLAAGAAALASALFALHPVVVEPVAWVTGRKDLLAAAFTLAAGLALLGRRRRPDDPSGARFGVVTLLCLLAMLAKPSAATAPLALYVLARAACPSWSRRRLGIGLAPAALLAAALALAGARGQEAIGSLARPTLREAALDVVGALALQATHLVAPLGLLAKYQRVAGDPSALLMTAALAGLAAVAWLTQRRFPPRSAARAGLLFAALAWLPASGILPLVRWTADSYVYLPLAGVALFVAAAAPAAPALVRAALPLALVGLGGGAFRQTEAWRDSVAVMRPVAARYPERPEALNLLAFALRADGHDDEAARTLITIEDRFPDFALGRALRVWAFRRAGDDARADAILARGVREGDANCGLLFWLDVIEGRLRLGPERRDEAAQAFRVGRPALRQMRAEHLRRIAGALRALGLPELAAQADADAASRA